LARCPDAQLWLSISNSARNSSMTHSNFEFASLELQRFWGISKNDRDKLRAKFGWRLCRFRPRVPQPGSASASQASCPAFAHIIAELPNFACNSPETLSNHEFTTLELQRLQTLLKLLLIELHAKFGRRLCRFRPRALQPGPAIARGHRSQALRTGGVWCAVIASPDAASHSVQSSPCMACWRRQRYKVRPARLVGGDSGTKFAMLGQNPPNCAFLGEQGEFCTARAVRRGEQGEFCTGSGAVRLVQGEFCLAVAPSSFPVVGLASPVGTAASHRAP